MPYKKSIFLSKLLWNFWVKGDVKKWTKSQVNHRNTRVAMKARPCLSFYGSLRIPSLLDNLQEALGSSLLQEASRTCSFLYLLQPPSRKQHFPQQLLPAQSQLAALSPPWGPPDPTLLTHFFHVIVEVFAGDQLPGPHKGVAHSVVLRRSLFQVRQRPQEGRCCDPLESE